MCVRCDYCVNTTLQVGMLNMISVLADYTNEVFSSILKESAGISNRLAIVGKRCESLTARVEATETCINSILYK